MTLKLRFLTLLVSSLAAVAGPGLVYGQDHCHAQPASEELARLNAEWDEQYAEYSEGSPPRPRTSRGGYSVGIATTSRKGTERWTTVDAVS